MGRRGFGEQVDDSIDRSGLNERWVGVQMAANRVNLRDLTHAQTVALAATLKLPAYRADQLFRWVHGRGLTDLAQMTDLSLALRAELAEKASIEQLAVDLEQVSKDGTRKLRLRTGDARLIETVLIPDRDGGAGSEESGDEEEDNQAFRGGRSLDDNNGPNPRRPKLTQCVSSQVGCALDCTFCATAKLGFGRNLTAGEIVSQVYFAEALMRDLPEHDNTRRAGADHVTNLVFMGMGEPLHNYSELVRALTILTDSRGLALSRRRITVSTAGLVPAIRKLGQEAVRVHLAISLNASNDAVRDRIMPINRKWPIAALIEAVREFPLERRRRVTFEYVLLADVNDRLEDAARLAALLRGIPCKVNLIPWNPHPLSDFRRPSDRTIVDFQNELKARGLAVYVRRSRGDDIDAACGQLAARQAPPVTLRTRPASAL